MKFERTDAYQRKLFLEAMVDEKRVILDATIRIINDGYKYRAYCFDTLTYLQFPNRLRDWNLEYIADVVEVINSKVGNKYFRAMKGSIRRRGEDEVLA